MRVVVAEQETQSAAAVIAAMEMGTVWPWEFISSDSLGTIFLPTHGPPITSMPPKRLHPGSEVEPEVIAEQTGDGEATVNEVEQPVKRRRGRPRKTDVSFPSSSFFPPINNIHF